MSFLDFLKKRKILGIFFVLSLIFSLSMMVYAIWMLQRQTTPPLMKGIFHATGYPMAAMVVYHIISFVSLIFLGHFAKKYDECKYDNNPTTPFLDFLKKRTILGIFFVLFLIFFLSMMAYAVWLVLHVATSSYIPSPSFMEDIFNATGYPVTAGIVYVIIFFSSCLFLLYVDEKHDKCDLEDQANVHTNQFSQQYVKEETNQANEQSFMKNFEKNQKEKEESQVLWELTCTQFPIQVQVLNKKASSTKRVIRIAANQDDISRIKRFPLEIKKRILSEMQQIRQTDDENKKFSDFLNFILEKNPDCKKFEANPPTGQ